MSRRVLRGFQPAQLVRLREQAGISRTDAARLARIGKRTIENWEIGAVSPQIDLLRQLTNVLGGTIGDVVHVPAEGRFPGDWRVLRALTQPELGRLVGLSTSTVGAVERGEMSLTDTTAKVIAQALEMPVDEYRAAYERARSRPPGTPA